MIYVNRKWDVKDLDFQAGDDWASVTFKNLGEPITVYSIYSPILVNGTPEHQWGSPILSLGLKDRRPPGGHHVVVGDFNLHHPSWDMEDRTSPGSHRLLTWARRWGLRRVTPYGEPTRPGNTTRGERDSTIDHAWVSRDVYAEFWGDSRCEQTGSDHCPQEVWVQIGNEGRKAETEEGYSWSLMDSARVLEEAERQITIPDRIEKEEDVGPAFDKLMEQLKEIAEVLVPHRKKSRGRMADWWNLEIKRATKDVRQKWWAWKAERTPLRWTEFETAKLLQRQLIKKAQTKRWRGLVAEASMDSRKLWALERWARLRSH